MSTAAIILAAGLGTRMRSALPKALHPIAGRPMLNHLLATCEAAGFERTVVVVGPGMEGPVRAAAPHAMVVVQADRLGTGHAALQAAPVLEGFAGDAAVLYADNPLISEATLRRLLARRAAGAGLALLAMRPADPGRYGRVVQDEPSGDVLRIVEWADADAAERGIGLCNAGVLCAPAADLLRWLRGLAQRQRQGRVLPDRRGRVRPRRGRRVVAEEAPEAELRGVNSRAELAEAEAAAQAALRAAAMAGGATLTAPETVFLSWDTRARPGCDGRAASGLRPRRGGGGRGDRPRLQPP